MTSRGKGVRSRITQITSKRLQPLDDGGRVADVVIEHGDRGAAGDLRPVGHGQRDVLVVVEDRDLHAANLAHPVYPAGWPGTSSDAMHVQRRRS